ncbi:leucine-rich repeat serine/threonine-protein kinase 2-like, partial [Saccostrea cucullata]|uniref:leucine-rich repeat serine/threonine-protein kinase 2-like n=2 Tax=Saccostrea cuccullata TaxID=36930 RepID=UPI002ED2E49D
MRRARGLIVGCAGAGKTTLLRQLQRTQTSHCPCSTETTIGLEIHEDLFEVKDDTLVDFNSKNENTEDGSQDKQIISMTDFAGQVAYYACHQIYLSRRAFYLVVMDLSKGLNEVVHTQDTDRHNPKGSLFHGWAYKDYFLFWLRSIKTYCDDGNKQETTNSPVILIASHHDCLK